MTCELICPECNVELEWHDNFGNLDFCLNSIGHPVGPYGRERNPIKAGDIYRCPKCEADFHTFIKDGQLHSGYPC